MLARDIGDRERYDMKREERGGVGGKVG